MLTLQAADAGRGARNAMTPAKRIAAIALYLIESSFRLPTSQEEQRECHHAKSLRDFGFAPSAASAEAVILGRLIRARRMEKVSKKGRVRAPRFSAPRQASVPVSLLCAAKLRHPHLPVLLEEVEVNLVAFSKLIRRQPALELCRVVPIERPLVSLLALHFHRLLDCLDADDLSFMRPLLSVA